MTPTRSRPSRTPTVSLHTVLGVGLLAGLILIGQSLLLWDFAIDDVGISYRYAAHLAQGEGLVWNPGETPVEGYSNFLWVLILAAARLLGSDIIVASKVLGILFGVLTLLGLTVMSARLWSPYRLWWICPILVAAVPEWTAWTVSGLEIALYCGFLLLGCLAWTAGGRSRTVLLTIAVCGLVLSRPEGALIALLMLGGVLFIDGPSNPMRERLRRIRVPLGALVLTTAALILFRMWYFGSPLPNTVHAKFDTSLPSLRLVLMWLGFCLPFLAGTLWAARSISDRNRSILFVGVFLLLVQMAIVLPVSPVMYFLHRYQIAFLPMIALTVPAIVRKGSESKMSFGILIAVSFLLWSMQGWPAVIEFYRWEQYVLERQRCVVSRLADLPDRPTVAMLDAGRIPYWTDLPAIDAWGLCDREIARQGFSPGLVLARNPQVYVLSLDVNKGDTSSGLALRPHLGMDIMTAKVSDFQQRYHLWKICSPGKTSALADSTSRYYDYGIFLNVAWAGQHGLGERITPVNWPY